MIIDLTQIEDSPRRFDFATSAGDLGLEESNVKFVSEIRASGEVEKRIAQINASGRITADAEIDCTRCLKAVPQNLSIDFSVSFVTPEHFAADKEREIASEDLDTDVLDADKLDLKDVVREQVLLNLPEQLFCRPDCKGLCPECGADSNLIDCDCDSDRTDPRWAALKNLK
ncbi:MAG TPA: DUF177 domain-containing protein [Pyrinomonadaceae bacterium]|nr:DUF177 domain-containing protein [Pyrinomonadaceae bacterium]